MSVGRTIKEILEDLDKNYVEPPPRKFEMQKPQEDEIRRFAELFVKLHKLYELTESEASKVNLEGLVTHAEIESEFRIMLEKVSRVFEGGKVKDEYITHQDTYRMVFLEYAETFDIYRRTIM